MSNIINPSYVPLIPPGNIFDTLNDDTNNYAVRWIQPTDPVYYTVANRPISDTVLRQLIISKAIDNIALRLSHQSNFPFIITPIVVNGSTSSGLPLSWIWDMHVSIYYRWENLRLAKIKRTSGTNGTGNYTGNLRLYFTADDSTSGTETYLFYVDYQIDSELTYQICGINMVTDETPHVDDASFSAMDGYILMRTINPDNDSTMESLLTDVLYPPVAPLTETVGELEDSAAGSASNPSDFDTSIVSHGTGILTLSAFNIIPAIDTIIDNWLIATNFPFRVNLGRTSIGSSPLTIPQGLFYELSIVAPSPDSYPSSVDDVFPVWISRIHREDPSASEIKFYFSTYDIEHSVSGYKIIEFASLTLNRSNRKNDVIHIVPEAPLYYGKTSSDWYQGFGEGHVVLSTKWGTSSLSSEVNDMFNECAANTQENFEFNMTQTLLSPYAVHRVPKNIPTNGQFAALKGTLGDADPPNSTNEFVVKNDAGLGEAVDLSATHGSKNGISDTGYKATHAVAFVKLEVTAEGTSYDFDNDIKPRLETLYGRSLQFGDFWFNGTRLLMYDGEKFIEV